MGCSGSSSGSFWGVCGLLHGGAGQKKVVFLATRSVSESNFALRGCLDTNLEAIWMFFGGSPTPFRFLSQRVLSSLERTSSRTACCLISQRDLFLLCSQRFLLLIFFVVSPSCSVLLGVFSFFSSFFEREIVFVALCTFHIHTRHLDFYTSDV